jgi:hypothetical protein
MFNVITNRVINDQPLELKDALSLANQFIYVSPNEVNQARLAFYYYKFKFYRITYGFSSVDIELAS